jgi:Arc/MetJ-type ribon-helix-helix transcriptional regulator
MTEMEKLTVNLNAVDLGQIELLVEHGFYANRAEFIRVAIHDQLAKHSDTVRETTRRQSSVIGAMVVTKQILEQHRAAGTRLSLRVVGFLAITDDVTPALASEVIDTVMVRGIFKTSKAVKDALADRTT